MLIREELDLFASIRDVKRLRAAAESGLAFRREMEFAEVRSTFAPLLIFPAPAPGDGTPPTADLIALLAGERIAAAFVEDG